MPTTDEMLSQAFTCTKCGSHGAKVERLSMAGTGLSRLLEVQTHRYAFASCNRCGYTEIYDLAALEGTDSLGTLLEILFAN